MHDWNLQAARQPLGKDLKSTPASQGGVISNARSKKVTARLVRVPSGTSVTRQRSIFRLNQSFSAVSLMRQKLLRNQPLILLLKAILEAPSAFNAHKRFAETRPVGSICHPQPLHIRHGVRQAEHIGAVIPLVPRTLRNFRYQR